MSREMFFLSIICLHPLTKCTCCRGFSDSGGGLPPSLVPIGFWVDCGFSNLPQLLQTDMSNQRRRSWPSYFTAASGHCPLHSRTGRGSADRPPSSGLLSPQLARTLMGYRQAALEAWCGHAHSHLWVHVHPGFLGKPAKYSTRSWCLRATGLHASSCVHLIRHGPWTPDLQFPHL